MKYVGWGFLLLIVIIGLNLVCGVINWGGKAVDVMVGQIQPKEIQRKYEWIRNQSAALEKSKHDIQIAKGQEDAMAKSYGETPRKDWDRTDKEQWSLWNQELEGIKFNYNRLAQDYNAEMSKWNWKLSIEILKKIGIEADSTMYARSYQSE